MNYVAFSDDGTHIVSGSYDQSIKVWNVRTHKEVATLKGHTHYVESVAFSHDGTHIVGTCGSNNIKVWNTHTHKEVFTLQDSKLPTTAAEWEKIQFQLLPKEQCKSAYCHTAEPLTLV